MPETVMPMEQEATFSEAIRKASWSMHGSAQHSSFMSELFAGTLDRQRYITLVGQHYGIYRALERASVGMRADPAAGPFVRDELARVPALFADLYAFAGADWESLVQPIDATRAYCERIEAVCADWPGGFVAHHYVRYMGDLSGGQAIRTLVARTLGFERDNGAAFYYFDGIEDADAFKQEYRRMLDGAPWDADEQQRIIDEILLAYDFNARLLNAI